MECFNEQNVFHMPSDEKAWLRYFPTEAKEGKYIDTSVYAYVKDGVEGNEYAQKPAIGFYGKDISYAKMLETVEDISDIFYAKGIRKNDIVSLCLPILPETIYVFLALNKLGAIANFIDPRINALRIRECLGTKTKILFSIDVYNQKIGEIADELKIEERVEISAADSLPFPLKFFYRAKQGRKNKGFDSWKQFCSCHREKAIDTSVDVEDVAAIVYTSGTTGVPKGAMLTNGGICSVCFYMRFPLSDLIPGDMILDIMPPFLAYGLVCGMCAPLAFGLKCQLIPEFKAEEFPGMVKKWKPQLILGVPFFFELLAKNQKPSGDLSFIKYLVAGGDRMTLSTEKMINEFITKAGIKNKIVKGYGMTELGSVAIVNISDEVNKLGSVGQPLYKNNVMIRDEKSGKELSYGKEGILYVTGPSLMKGYVGHPEEEEKVFSVIDGVRWVNTGDLGYIDKEGNVFISGRKKRMIVRPDGHNVFPVAIEQVISEHPLVDSVVVIGLPSKNSENGSIPTACIVFKAGCRETSKAIEEIKELSLKKLPPRDVALEYYVIEKIPISNVGKIDYQEIEILALTMRKNS